MLLDLQRKCAVFILAGGEGQRLAPLTLHRAKPAVPFGGVYRIIDFTLSNCLNSGLRRIYVLTQYASTSLARHLRNGWNIFHGELGEFILQVPPQRIHSDRFYAGTADAIYQNLALLQDERPEHVVVLSGDHVYKMDYAEMVRCHEEHKADLTIACCAMPREQCTQLGVAEAADDGRIRGFQEKPADPQPMPEDPSRSLANMGVYVFRTEVLVQRVIEDAREDTEHDFGRNVIPQMIERDRVFAYPFQQDEGRTASYWRDIGTLDSYWAANMDLVEIVPEFNLYDRAWPIRTFQPQHPPAKTIVVSRHGPTAVTNTLLSAGCVVSSAHVNRSVLSPGVRVREGSKVSESVLMEDVDVGAGSVIHRTIVDSGVQIPPGTQIGVDLGQDRRRFTVTHSGIVVVPRRAVFE